MPKIKDISRWQVEIDLAKEFRKNEFGEYSKESIWKAGENIEYYERGLSSGYQDTENDSYTTLNLFHALTKNVVPALYYKNPRINVLPRRKGEDAAAPVAGEIVNYYYKEIDADSQNKRVVFDAYVLGKGYSKVGYCTKFGPDIEDEDEKKESQKTVLQGIKEILGIKKLEEEKVNQKLDLDMNIVSEMPYIQYISPFNILIDPRATSMEDAQWIAHCIEKTVEQVKQNKKYKNTNLVVGTEPRYPIGDRNMPQSEIDAFKTVQLYEIHYRQPDGIYILVVAEDAGAMLTELYHEKSPYKIDGWQFEELDFNLHAHKYYKASELTKIKNLQDRFTSVTDAIMTQVDSFLPKIAVDETALSGEQAMRALTDGDIGAVVKCNKNPEGVFKELSLTQYKGDLAAINNEIINLVTIQSGVTRAQLTGMASARSATEAQIEQGGSTLRLAEMSEQINKYSERQARKLWQIIQQFVELEELEIITGEAGINPETGLQTFTWLPDIDSEMAEKLIRGDFRFEVSVGSSQRADNALITKRIENLMSILARTDVIALMQQQGKKVDLAEILRLWLVNNPEVAKDTSRIIQDVTQATNGLLPAEQILTGGGQGGFTQGSAANQMEAMRGGAAPNMGSIAQESRQI